MAKPTPHEFSAGGRLYRYAASRDPRGVVHLRGMADEDSFDLSVKSRTVQGLIGTTPIRFNISEELLAELNREVPAAGTPVRQAAATSFSTMAVE
jgi:hypothetical protein